MKFSFTRKINLANIDRELWPYETEDISISDADSFEEAQKMVDKLVAERIGYYRAQSDAHKASKVHPATASNSTAGPAPAPVFTPTPAPVPAPAAPAAAPAPAVPPNPSGVNSQPPEEFNV